MRIRVLALAAGASAMLTAGATAVGQGGQTGPKPAGAKAVPADARLQFRPQQIASDFGVGYAVTTADVNGDARTDVLALSGTDIVWFGAPGFEKHVMLSGVTPKDNVCFAPHDIDRDGRLDVAVGATWQPSNTSGGGTLHWVRQGAPGADPSWELHGISEEPTLHRIRWADVDGDKEQELIVAPLHGRGTKGPEWQGPGARLLIFEPPAKPASEPWRSEVADDSLHILHNFLPANMDADPQDEIITASREGVSVVDRGADGKWSRTLIGEGSPGEIKLGRVGGRRMLATVEPWHGQSVVIYGEKPGLWERSVIESQITGGHALGWGDFDGDGSDELAVGWRDATPGLAVYSITRDGALRAKTMIDDGGMATEDLTVADLNGDGRPDIVASGRATRNVKIYWNETRK